MEGRVRAEVLGQLKVVQDSVYRASTDDLLVLNHLLAGVVFLVEKWKERGEDVRVGNMALEITQGAEDSVDLWERVRDDVWEGYDD